MIYFNLEVIPGIIKCIVCHLMFNCSDMNNVTTLEHNWSRRKHSLIPHDLSIMTGQFKKILQLIYFIESFPVYLDDAIT